MPENVRQGRFKFFRTSYERILVVVDDIRAGSDPRLSFYALLVTSSLIAAIGLIADSPAVIIGAMLVSPLMTPIFGIGLGVLRADASLVRRALIAECVGVFLAIAVAYLLGMLLQGVEPTPEMLIRTDPHLLDLLVALLAGFAGAYAFVDERVSPALPGVAIATAIVPPLANTGLCLALGAPEGAVGSFMLFIANFFAILVVGLLTFAAAGVSPALRWTEARDLLRHFGFATTGLLVVAVILTPPLIQTIRDRRTEYKIDNVLEEELGRYGPAVLDDSVHRREDDAIEVLATVRSPRVITPKTVSYLQQALADALKADTRLVVRTELARDVAAMGSDVQVDDQDLDRDLLERTRMDAIRAERIAEQVLYEELGSEPGFVLERVEIGRARSGPIVLAKLAMFESLGTGEVSRLRELIRVRLNEPGAELMVDFDRSDLVVSQERMLPEWTNLASLTPADEPEVRTIRKIIAEQIQAIPDLFCLETHLNIAGERWRVLAEVAGPHPPTRAQVAVLQTAVRERSSRPVEVN